MNAAPGILPFIWKAIHPNGELRPTKKAKFHPSPSADMIPGHYMARLSCQRILPKPSFLYWNPIITVRERSNAIGNTFC